MKTLHLIDQVMLIGTCHVWSWVIMKSLKMPIRNGECLEVLPPL